MHSAVLQNKKYIKWAEKNAVDVMSLSRLSEGMQKGDRRAATYKKKGPDGSVQEYLVEWPSLTPEQIEQLSRSPARRFNNTGKIPFTAIVDPYTEKEIGRISGGYSAKQLMDIAAAKRKELVKAHGKGVSHKTLKLIEAGMAKAKKLLADNRYAKSLKALRIMEKLSANWPESLKSKVAAMREQVVASATAALKKIEDQAADDPASARRALSALMSRLKGTGLEEKARALLKSL